jgi:peroxiredoxin
MLYVVFIQDHAPAFIKQAEAIKKKGVNSIVCVAVNDPFVTDAWGKSLNAGNKVSALLLKYAIFFTLMHYFLIDSVRSLDH